MLSVKNNKKKENLRNLWKMKNQNDRMERTFCCIVVLLFCVEEKSLEFPVIFISSHCILECLHSCSAMYL